MIERIKLIHALYERLTGFKLILDPWRTRCWYDFFKRDLAENDLRLVIAYLQSRIRIRKRNPGALKFSNLIEQIDRFEEDLGLAKGFSRNNQPKTNRDKAIAELRPVSTEVMKDSDWKRVDAILPKLLEEMRRAAR